MLFQIGIFWKLQTLEMEKSWPHSLITWKFDLFTFGSQYGEEEEEEKKIIKRAKKYPTSVMRVVRIRRNKKLKSNKIFPTTFVVNKQPKRWNWFNTLTWDLPFDMQLLMSDPVGSNRIWSLCKWRKKGNNTLFTDCVKCLSKYLFKFAHKISSVHNKHAPEANKNAASALEHSFTDLGTHHTLIHLFIHSHERQNHCIELWAKQERMASIYNIVRHVATWNNKSRTAAISAPNSQYQTMYSYDFCGRSTICGAFIFAFGCNLSYTNENVYVCQPSILALCILR